MTRTWATKIEILDGRNEGAVNLNVMLMIHI